MRNKAAALEQLIERNNYARCSPVQPEKPVVFVKLPSGVVVQVEREMGGYRLAGGHSIQDNAFFTKVVGERSTGVPNNVHGSAKINYSNTGSVLSCN